MDVQSLLGETQDSLRNFDRGLSTSTAAAPRISLAADDSVFWKTGASAVMGLAGMVYLSHGKKNGDVRNMIIGAALTLGSFFIF